MRVRFGKPLTKLGNSGVLRRIDASFSAVLTREIHLPSLFGRKPGPEQERSFSAAAQPRGTDKSEVPPKADDSAEEPSNNSSGASSEDTSTPKQHVSAQGWLSREMGYLREQMKKSGKRKGVPRRDRKHKVDVDWEVLRENTRAQNLRNSQAEERAAEEAMKAATTEGDSESKEPAPVPMVVEAARSTVWEDRFQAWKEKAKRPIRQIKSKIQESVQASRNEYVREALRKSREVQSTVEDIKEQYETSQTGVLSKVRDAVESMSAETDTGRAMGMLESGEADFYLPEFLEDMENYMIPVVVEAFLRGDEDVLAAVLDGTAKTTILNTVRQRKVVREMVDPRVLFIRNVDFTGAVLVGDIPCVTLTFVCQQLNCVRNIDTGEIKEGSERDIKSVFYQWVLARHGQSEEFDWKIMDMSYHHQYSLV